MTTNQQADPLIGRLVDGRYRVRARIARGGMATVYVATDLRLERRIALKVMHSHLSDDSVFKNRFIQEARAAARLADPHVVNVFDQGQDGELAYLVMEYLPGITLRELLREQRRLSVTQTLTIMDAILSGLSAAHRASIVHRDVKPENVLLAEDGRIKIGDFGLARATTANTATGQQLMGTIAYLAPELVTRGTADARSDIYSLGIMLYEMLVGEQPYKGEQPMQIAFQHATESVPRPSARNPSVPEQLDELVLWSTEKVPDERPRDAQEMLDRLRQIERELGIAPTIAAATATAHSASDSGQVTRILPGSRGLTATKVLPGTSPLDVEAPAAETIDNATLLRRRSAHRRARGTLLLTVTLLLAVLAGGVGWWFGSGPGSLVAVPAVVGKSFDDASAALTAQGFVPVRADENSTTVDAGTTISTDPEAGTRVDAKSSVTVVVSAGPAEHEIPALAGMAAADAKAVLQQNGVNLTDDEEFILSDVAEGNVLNVRIAPRSDPSATFECGPGCTLHEDDTATVQVSIGAMPDVSGMTVSEATNALEGKKLQVSTEQTKEYSSTFEAGQVIRVADRAEEGLWRPGDTATLVVSLGPELFPVPDVTGKTRDAAAQALRDAGFKPTWNSVWSAFPNDFTEVKGTDPAAGSQRQKGTEITLQIGSTAF